MRKPHRVVLSMCANVMLLNLFSADGRSVPAADSSPQLVRRMSSRSEFFSVKNPPLEPVIDKVRVETGVVKMLELDGPSHGPCTCGSDPS
ncbi:unnamed protein product, partial [Notodromas monacha]